MLSVLIIHPEGNSFNNPSMKSLIDLLVDRNVLVAIYHERSIAPMPKYKGVQYISWGRLLGRLKNFFKNKFLLIYPLILISYIERLRFNRSFDLIIGVDREGLIEAHIFSEIYKKPYVFISFEIMFGSETSRRFKEIERTVSKNVSHWFVQDNQRASILCVENGLNINDCTTIPLASKGGGAASTKRLRDNLGIPIFKKVAILMGSLSDWTMSIEIIKSVIQWPDDWCIIVHDRYGQTQQYIEKIDLNIIDLVGHKLFISNECSEHIDNMSYILSGIDLGFAFYNPNYLNRYTGLNLKNIGLASGKISTFLRHGIPVFMNDVGQYSDLASEFGFGLVLDSPDNISLSLSQFNHNDAARAAKKFFIENLDFSLYEDRVFSDLLRTIKHGD